MDFGLALWEEAGATLTQEGQVLGTPAYMSPEQAAGRGHQADGRSDIYSLGVVLYELLTGEVPFRGTRTQVIHQVIHAEARPVRQGNGKVPRDLETICLKALAKEPARRYATAGELADDLRRFLRDEPIRARPARAVERLWRWARRNPVVAGLTTAVAALLIAAAAGATLATFREQRLRSEAENAKQEAVDQVVTLHVTNGIRLMDEGDLFGALPFLVRALELDQGHPEREEMHRWRIGAVLQQCPRLVYLWPHAGKVVHAAFDAEGRRAVTAADDGAAHLWDVETGRHLAILRHEAAVRHATFSPDGGRVATASADGTARLWEAATGQALTPPLRHDQGVTEAAFSPDGRWVVTAAMDKAARVWDAATGQLLHTLTHDYPVYHAAFSPDGRRLLTAARDNPTVSALRSEVCLWDADDGQRLRQTRGPATDGVPFADVYATFTPDGGRLLLIGKSPGGRNGKVQMLETESGRPLATFYFPEHLVMHAALSPDGRLLATGGGAVGADTRVQVWETATGKAVCPPLPHGASVQDVAFSPEGGRLLTACGDGTARVWDAVTGRPLSPWLRHGGSLAHAVFHPDGRRLVTAGHDGLARLWDLATAERRTPPLKHRLPFGVTGVAFSPEGDRVITTSFDGSARVWDAATGEPITPRPRCENHVHHAAFSPDGRRFVMTTGSTAYPPAFAGQTLAGWVRDAATGALVAGPLRHEHEVVHAAFSPDGRWVVTASGRWYARHQDRDGEARVWDAATGLPRGPVLKHPGPVRHAVFHPDGAQVVTACADGTARVWNAATGELLRSLACGREISWAEFSPGEGRRLLAAGVGGAWLWDTATGTRLATLAPGLEILAATFSPDGRLAATAGADGTAQVWSAGTGQPRTPPLRHRARVAHVVFSPDGRRLAATSLDQTVRLWDVATGRALSPPLNQGETVVQAAFSPDGRRLVTAGSLWQALLWELSADTRPLGELSLVARLLAAHGLAPAGELTPLASPALTDAWQQLTGKSPGQFRASDAEAAAWYRTEADRCLRQRRWAEAVWHLDRLVQTGPVCSQDWYERGRAHAELGHWEPAAADYARVLQQRLVELDWQVEYGILHLAAGDTPGYRAVCARLMEQYGRSDDVREVEMVTSLCVLAPAALTEPDQAVSLAQRRTGLYRMLGPALYRAGRYAAAARRLEQDVAPFQDYTGNGCRLRLFLALAHHRLGHAEEARQWLDRATRWIDAYAQDRTANRADFRTNWTTALSLTLLRREAEGLIRPEPEPNSK